MSRRLWAVTLGYGLSACTAASPETAADSVAAAAESEPGATAAESASGAAGEASATDAGSLAEGPGNGADDKPPAAGPDPEEPAPPQSEGPATTGDALALGSCQEALPKSFSTTCASCHPGTGSANPKYPDLYEFSGSEAQFISQVRNGGALMLAYPETVISDGDLSALYAYFSDPGGRRASSDGAVLLTTPLFNESDSLAPPIVFERDDGVLITRGAGRVRQRHEQEGTFNPYGPHYFEDRSYGILVEDYTPLGESLIRVTYLPVAMPTDGTNFRAWKVYGDGNLFAANTGMEPAQLPSLAAMAPPPRATPVLDASLASSYADVLAPYAAIQSKESTSNSRTGGSIESGDLFEFEFGVFIEAGAVRDGSRTSYYTDTFRYRVGLGGLTAQSDDTGGQLGPAVAAQQGGDGTNVWLYEDGEFAFEQMALNIQHENVQAFLRGRRLFHTDFATGEHSEGGNPGFDEQAGKAGPLFAATSCETCHIHNGPGALLTDFDQNASMVFKLTSEAALGRQLQLQEGDVTVALTEADTVTLSDGETVTLHRPAFDLSADGAALTHYSARLARKVIGMGLLEAISEATLLGRADPFDCNGDGISGRPALAAELATSSARVGRFGWKAEKMSVRHQVVDALEGDLGVGTSELPDTESNVELDDAAIGDLETYMRLISVPAQRDIDSPEVHLGETVFRTLGCSGCHATDVVTGADHPFAELRGQSIKPYTDLLLHDMGPGLADASGVAASEDIYAPASAAEWRTPPLWGLGLHATVNGNTGLLHDGRAASALEAILWHGGEAEAVRERFVALPAEERNALLTFLESL